MGKVSSQVTSPHFPKGKLNILSYRMFGILWWLPVVEGLISGNLFLTFPVAGLLICCFMPWTTRVLQVFWGPVVHTVFSTRHCWWSLPEGWCYTGEQPPVIPWFCEANFSWTALIMPVPLSNAFIPGAQQPTPVPATVDEVYQGDGALQVSNHPSYPGFSVVVCMDYFDNTKPAVIYVLSRWLRAGVCGDLSLKLRHSSIPEVSFKSWCGLVVRLTWSGNMSVLYSHAMLTKDIAQ